MPSASSFTQGRPLSQNVLAHLASFYKHLGLPDSASIPTTRTVGDELQAAYLQALSTCVRERPHIPPRVYL